jgi:prevent-host-death family protein
MTIHVNIGEAKAKLSKLIAATMRGEEVVIDHAGKPKVRLTPVAEAESEDKVARRLRIDAILVEADKIPRRDDAFELEWDENGLPI